MAERQDTFYPADGAIHGYGAQLLISDGAATPVFSAVAGIVSITPGDMSTADIDRTHLRSPDAHREHMPGMRDSGPFVAAMIWLPKEESQSNAGGGAGPFTDGGLIAKWRARTVHNWKIKLNDTDETEWPFIGYVSKFQPGEIGVDDKINATVEFQPTQAYDDGLP